jgi:hypothetical protein
METEPISKTWVYKMGQWTRLSLVSRYYQAKIMEHEVGGAHMQDVRNVYKILAGRPEGKKELGSPKYRWEDNIKWILRKCGRLTWHRIRASGGLNVNTVTRPEVP